MQVQEIRVTRHEDDFVASAFDRERTILATARGENALNVVERLINALRVAGIDVDEERLTKLTRTDALKLDAKRYVETHSPAQVARRIQTLHAEADAEMEAAENAESVLASVEYRAEADRIRFKARLVEKYRDEPQREVVREPGRVFGRSRVAR